MNSSGNVTQTNNRPAKSNQNIQVYVRVRPLNFRERAMRSLEVVEVSTPKEILVKQAFDSKTTKKFTFDRAFGPDSRQSEVYHTVVAPLIEEVLSGYNCTVFAYGQTGTGKTHTMIGTEVPELKSSWEDESMVGIIPRALSHLFDELRMMEVEFSMRISYLELYNEELCDLLSSDDSTKIRIFDDSTKKGSIIVQGLEEIPVHSKDDVYKLLEKGKERRKTAATLINAQSSRSHTVFSILVHIKENGIDGEEMLKIGKLNLVDLAGSENISKAGNEKGIRTRETVNINQSLLTLGRVITALVERTPHIPYRESKLTRLLQESLGGRTKTSIIATISPGHKDLEETLSTLEYAHRAKNIQNKPEINQKLTKKTVIKEYTEEIDRLKRDLIAARDKNGIYLAEETYTDMQYKLESQNKELNEKSLLVKALKDELQSKEKLFTEVSLNLVIKSEELLKTEKNLTNTKSELDHTKKVLTKTKRKVVEKEQIVESHVKTEKVLTEQASQLIEVADVATADTHQLISTIERRKGVENQNISACDAFVNRLVSLLDSQMEQHNNFTKDQNVCNQILGDEIGKHLSDHKKFSSNFVNKTKTTLKHCMESLSGIESCRENYNEQFADANLKHKVAFTAVMNELKEEHDNLKSHMEKLFTEMSEFVNENSSIVAMNCAKVIEIENNRNGILKDFTTKACSHLGQFKGNIKSDWEEVIATITSAIEARNNSSKRKKAFLEYILKEMQSFEEEETKETAKLQTLVENSEKFSCSMESSVDFELKAIQELNENSLKQSVTETISQIDSERLGLVEKCTNSTTLAQTYLNAHLDKTSTALTNSEKLIDEHVNTFDQTIKGFRDDASSMEDAFKKQATEDCDQAIELLNKESERVKLSQTQIGALNKSLQKGVQEYSVQYTQSVVDCKNSLQSFKESEIKAYTPTGQTPSRKEFSYPRILAATSPHANIVRRFRMEKEWSDADTTANTIMEDSELTLQDISIDELGINSTPLNIEPLPEDTKLRDIKSDFNCHISQISGIDTKPLSRRNSPALLFDKENKENCIV